MILAIGEILFDHFPGYRRVGGAPLNFSYHLKKLGFPARLVSRVGDDQEGRELQSLLQMSGFEEEDLQIDPKHRTGAVNVTVDGDGVPTFDVLPDAAFDHLEMNKSVRSVINQDPELVYYGTLVQRTSKVRRFMEAVFSYTGKSTRSFCDLNLRPRCYSREIVEASLLRADVLKLNEEELETITGFLGGNGSEKDQCHCIMERYGIGMLALTRGEKGSEIHSGEGNHTIGPVEGTPVADTVGAGDAYSSILAIGYLGGWHPEKILKTASMFSAGICRIEGALPETDLIYDEFKKLVGEKDDEK